MLRTLQPAGKSLVPEGMLRGFVDFAVLPDWRSACMTASRQTGACAAPVIP